LVAELLSPPLETDRFICDARLRIKRIGDLSLPLVGGDESVLVTISSFCSVRVDVADVLDIDGRGFDTEGKESLSPWRLFPFSLLFVVLLDITRWINLTGDRLRLGISGGGAVVELQWHMRQEESFDDLCAEWFHLLP